MLSSVSEVERTKWCLVLVRFQYAGPHSHAMLTRPHDSGLRLTEVFVLHLSRALSSASDSPSKLLHGLEPPALPLAVGGSPLMHVLSSVSAAGLDLRAGIYNEFYAFLGLCLQLARDDAATAASAAATPAQNTPAGAESPAPRSRSLLDGLRAIRDDSEASDKDLDREQREQRRSAGLNPPLRSYADVVRSAAAAQTEHAGGGTSAGTPRSGSALTTLAAMPPYRLSPSAKLYLLHLCAANLAVESKLGSGALGAAGVSAGELFSRAHDLQALSRLGVLHFVRQVTASQAPGLGAAAPWALRYAAWSLLRMLTYAAADSAAFGSVGASVSASEEDAASSNGDVCALLLDMLLDELQSTDSAIRRAAKSSPTAEATGAAAAAALHELTEASLADASISFYRLLAQLAMRPSSATEQTVHALHLQRCGLLWAVLRCCRSLAVRHRLAASAAWLAYLVPLSIQPWQAPAVSAAASTAGAASGFSGTPIAALLAIRVLRAVLPLVPPTSPLLLSPIAFGGASSGADIASPGARLVYSWLQRIGTACLASLAQCAPSLGGVSAQMRLADELVALLRTMLATAHAASTTAAVAQSSSAGSAAKEWLATLTATLQRHIGQLRSLSMDALQTPATAFRPESPYARLAPLLAGLWVLGGGISVLGDGARVAVAVQGVMRTGTVIRTLPASGAARHTRNFSALLDGAHYEVLMDGLLADIDLASPAGSTLGGGSSVTAPGNSGQHSAASGPTSSDDGGSDEQQRPDVYTFAASALTAVDAVPVPLRALSASMAHALVYALGAFLRTVDAEVDPDAAQSIAATAAAPSSTSASTEASPALFHRARLSSNELHAAGRSSISAVGGTVSSSSGCSFNGGSTPGSGRNSPARTVTLSRRSVASPRNAAAVAAVASSDGESGAESTSAAIAACGQQLVWSELKQRSIKVLDSLLQRDELSALVLQLGLGPLLVPLALTELHERDETDSDGIKGTHRRRSSSTSTGHDSGIDSNSDTDSDSDDEANGAARSKRRSGSSIGSASTLGIVELEARLHAVAKLLVQRKRETPAQSQLRRTAWAQADQRSERKRAEMQQPQHHQQHHSHSIDSHRDQPWSTSQHSEQAPLPSLPSLLSLPPTSASLHSSAMLTSFSTVPDDAVPTTPTLTELHFPGVPARALARISESGPDHAMYAEQQQRTHRRHAVDVARHTARSAHIAELAQRLAPLSFSSSICQRISAVSRRNDAVAVGLLLDECDISGPDETAIDARTGTDADDAAHVEAYGVPDLPSTSWFASTTARSLAPASYFPKPPTLPDGITKIRSYLAAYTEREAYGGGALHSPPADADPAGPGDASDGEYAAENYGLDDGPAIDSDTDPSSPGSPGSAEAVADAELHSQHERNSGGGSGGSESGLRAANASSAPRTPRSEHPKRIS